MDFSYGTISKIYIPLQNILKNLEPSYKTDLYFGDLLWKGKTSSINRSNTWLVVVGWRERGWGGGDGERENLCIITVLLLEIVNEAKSRKSGRCDVGF